MKLITNKSKNLLYRIKDGGNVNVQFGTSYAIATQITADSATWLNYKCQYRKNNTYLRDVFTSSGVTSTGKITRTFTTPADLDCNTIVFGLNGATTDTLVAFPIKLKPSTTYTFTCNFTNITQGSVSWKDMMLVEGSTVGDYEPYSYNLLDKWQYPATQTLNGVTFTNNSDGSITANGTNTGDVRIFLPVAVNMNLKDGHYYCMSGNVSDWSVNTYCTVFAIVGTGADREGETIFKYTEPSDATGTKNGFYIRVSLGVTVNNAIFKSQLYDLTAMYGFGNEPTTVDQFYADYPELKVSPLGFIGLKNLEINNKNIKRLRYKTWNNSLNLIDKSNFRSSDVGSGVTFTNNGDGSWTVNGTATSQNYFMLITEWMQLNTSHKYLLSGCPKEGSSDLFLYVDHGGSLFDYDTGNGSIGTPTKNSGTITISVSNNTVVNNAIFKPQLYDLTEIYGAGKEPTTVEQFYKDHPLAKTSPLGFSDLGIIPSNSGIH